MCGCKEEDFWKFVTFGHYLPCPQCPRGARDLKFTIYVPLVLKMLHTKCDKNWTGGYQEEVVNRHYVPNLTPPWGQNPYPGDHQIYNFGRGHPALHHHAFGFSQACAVVKKKIFENLSLLDSFCPTPKAPGCKRPEIYNLSAPCPKDASYQIWKELDWWLSRRS